MAKRTPRHLRSIVARLREHHPNGDDSLIERLHDLVEEFGDVGAALAHLLARGDTEQLRSDAMLLLFTAAKAPEVPEFVRGQIASSARPLLLEALRDPRVPDDVKYHIGPVHELCGGKLQHEEYARCFADFEGTVRRMASKPVPEFDDSLKGAEVLLEMLGVVRHDAPPNPTDDDLEQAIACGLKAAHDRGDPGAMLLATAIAIAIEHGQTDLVTRAGPPALALFERIGTGRSVWLLGLLGRLPGSGAFGEAALRMANALSARGARATAPRVGKFSHGIASAVDGAGHRNITLFFRSDERELDALVLLLSEDLGVKDAWSIFGNAADMDEQIRAASGDELTYAPCTIELARKLLADAYATHVERGTPAPGRLVLYSAFLGAEPIEARRHVPNLGAYALETHVRGPALVERSGHLLEDRLFAGLWFSSDAAYAFVRDAAPVRKSRRHSVSDHLIDAFLLALESYEKPLLIRRLAAILEIESLAGRARQRRNTDAARLWLALHENVVPFVTIPYVRSLARQAIPTIRENLALGYESQRDVNQASLDVPEFLADSLGTW